MFVGFDPIMCLGYQHTQEIHQDYESPIAVREIGNTSQAILSIIDVGAKRCT